MNGIYLYFVNKHLSSWPLKGDLKKHDNPCMNNQVAKSAKGFCKRNQNKKLPHRYITCKCTSKEALKKTKDDQFLSRKNSTCCRFHLQIFID